MIRSFLNTYLYNCLQMGRPLFQGQFSGNKKLLLVTILFAVLSKGTLQNISNSYSLQIFGNKNGYLLFIS